MSDPEKLKFKLEVLDFSSELIKMQLIFENPYYVSTMAEKDVLVVNLNDSREECLLSVDGHVLRKKIPN